MKKTGSPERISMYRDIRTGLPGFCPKLTVQWTKSAFLLGRPVLFVAVAAAVDLVLFVSQIEDLVKTLLDR